jgi:hypothetical protein
VGKKAVLCVVLVAAASVGGVVLYQHLSKPALTPLTAEMKAGLMSAAYVPADVSTYSSSQRLADQWTRIWKSNAVQNLLRMPLVQQGLFKLQQSEPYRQVMMTVQRHPLAVQALPVLGDAVSTEVFACTGPELAEFVVAFQRVVNSAQMQGMQDTFSGRPGVSDDKMSAAGVEALLNAVLTEGDNLRMPNVLIGCKLEDPAAAVKLLDTWLPQISATPAGKIEKANGFYSLNIRGASLPEEAYEEIAGELREAGVPMLTIVKFTQWVKKQNLLLAIGVKDDYLMISIGRDMALVDNWGQGTSLAESAALEPVRKRYKAGLMSLSYLSKNLASQFSTTTEDVRDGFRMLTEMLPPDSPEGLKPRLRKDLDQLTDDLENEMPQPGAMLSFSFENRGVESYTIQDGASSALDGSKRLSVMEHRGPEAIIAAASRALPNRELYELLAKWAPIAFGYVEDYGVPQMDADDRKKYDGVMARVRPFVKSLDDTTRDYFLPAVDGTQSVLALDGGGALTQLPNVGPLPKPLPIPRLGMVIELHDVGKFITAVTQYVDSAQKLLDGIHKEFPQGMKLTIPPPKTEQLAGGTLYYYPIPGGLGDDVFPCALIKDRTLVLTSSKKLAATMLDKTAMPSCTVTALDAPAASITLFDGAKLWSWLADLTDSGYAAFQRYGAESSQDLMQGAMVKMHIEMVLRSLGAIRGYRSVTALENGKVVTHSWLHIEDIK